jgi:hypothetical protein
VDPAPVHHDRPPGPAITVRPSRSGHHDATFPVRPARSDPRESRARRRTGSAPRRHVAVLEGSPPGGGRAVRSIGKHADIRIDHNWEQQQTLCRSRDGRCE